MVGGGDETGFVGVRRAYWKGGEPGFTETENRSPCSGCGSFENYDSFSEGKGWWSKQLTWFGSGGFGRFPDVLNLRELFEYLCANSFKKAKETQISFTFSTQE